MVAPGRLFLLFLRHGKSIYSSSYAFTFFRWKQHFDNKGYSRTVRGRRNVRMRVDGYKSDVRRGGIFRYYARQKAAADYRN